MTFKKKVIVLLSLGVVVVIVQAFSISLLSSQPLPRLPWGGDGGVGAHRDTRGNMDLDVASSPQQQGTTLPSSIGMKLSLSSLLPPNNATPSGPSSVSNSNSHSSSPETEEESISIVPVPVPKDLWNCDISDIKDAMSALNRAKSSDCKELIHNVTCLQKAGKLYNTEIKNTCPGKRNPGRTFEHVPYELGKGSTARVVFLMSIHGRAVRQVKRLFKAIYHTDHYYYVHVDSRSDYLYRNVHEALSEFPNVYFPTWRMATIWGGASLLQMLLRALQDLETVLKHWEWDYFINLSESDYPIRTNEELGKFLRVHRGNNFVKTHGADLNKFIRKQGLDRTFVECDNHMWRVNNRPLPPDIDVDGGSDWIAIHRNYSRYLVTSKDQFLLDLKRYFQFSLLPAESFFHTVLRNGPFCETFVRSNLRVTNWNRKLGCQCQYKHIVDWCGCSPNDFLSKDMVKLKAPSDHTFFARKFEAIVNQDVIQQLDFHLYGSLPSDLPGLTSYWESVYHSDDTLTKSSSARYTVYQSFLRTVQKLLHSEVEAKDKGESTECSLPREAVVREVSVYSKADQFQGLVVTVADSSTFPVPVFEIFFTRIPHLKSFGPGGINPLSLEVGSNWDVKESVFRNYGGILGVWDDPVAVVRPLLGHYSELEIIWMDPTGARANLFVMKLEPGWSVSFHKPKLERPIMPGLWSVKLRAKGSKEDLLRTDFSVVPLVYENKQRLVSPESVNAARLKGGTPARGHEAEFMSWKRNITKSGAELEGWVDDIVQQYWTVDSYCRGGTASGNVGGASVIESGCAWMPNCVSTSWSTLSPDPKSRLGEVQSNGRLR